MGYNSKLSGYGLRAAPPVQPRSPQSCTPLALPRFTASRYLRIAPRTRRAAAAAAKTDGRRLRLPSGPRDVPSAERLAREGWRQSAVEAVQSDRLRRCGSSSRCIFGRRRAGRASWRQRASRVTRLVSMASTTWSCSSASRTRWRRTRAASCQFLKWQVRHRAVPNMAGAASCS